MGKRGHQVALSIIIPALNEAAGLRGLLPALRRRFPDAEILVIDDGSDDDTDVVANEFGCQVVSNPYRMGNGAAIKRGVRAAHGAALAMMDADGQHSVSDLERLWSRFQKDDLDMLIGARGARDHASLLRRLGNAAFNRLASWMTGQRILDLTSGLRICKAGYFREFLHLLPNGFSYPTTSTMAFFRSGYTVAFEPIEVRQRLGSSHLMLWREGLRFLVIIFKIGALYSPLKLFAPISALLFALATLLYVGTFWDSGRFTNMSLLLYMSSLLTFLIGIVSEQVTSLMFAQHKRK